MTKLARLTSIRGLLGGWSILQILNFPLTTWFLLGIACFVCVPIVASSAVFAEEKIAICHAGLITLPPFTRQLKALRASGRYSAEKLAELQSRRRKGGADFFSSQIIVQEHISGSGTFNLKLFHGISTARYRNVTAWACAGADYPIIYFVGYRVRQIENGTVFVSREKEIVNVISFKDLDSTLSKGFSVKIFKSEVVLCKDIGTGCTEGIFYDRYES